MVPELPRDDEDAEQMEEDAADLLARQEAAKAAAGGTLIVATWSFGTWPFVVGKSVAKTVGKLCTRWGPYVSENKGVGSLLRKSLPEVKGSTHPYSAAWLMNRRVVIWRHLFGLWEQPSCQGMTARQAAGALVCVPGRFACSLEKKGVCAGHRHYIQS